MGMKMLGEIMRHRDEVYPLMKLMLAAKLIEKRTPLQPHWAFCYTTLRNVSRSFALLIQQLPTDLRNVRPVQHNILEFGAPVYELPAYYAAISTRGKFQHNILDMRAPVYELPAYYTGPVYIVGTPV